MDFSVRATGLRERMDDPACDLGRLHNTYRQFEQVNRLLAGWGGAYRRWIRPRLSPDGRVHTVLDVGCGGAGLLPMLHRWMTREGVACRLTGLDTDLRAIDYARRLDLPPEISFRHGSLEELAASGARFDVVVCNHVLHHLEDADVEPFLSAMRAVTQGIALVGDPLRSRWAYGLFAVCFGPLFRDSFIVEDGLASIRRAFSLPELRWLCPAGWQVRPQFPFRVLLTSASSCEGKSGPPSGDR